MDIKLTEREEKFLREFYEKQKDGAKDNVGTREAIHVVEREERVFVPTKEDIEVWIDAEDEYEEYESFEALIEARRRECGADELPELCEVLYERINDVFICDINDYAEAFNIKGFYSGRYVYRYTPVAFFFIRDEAVRYMTDYQAHNCDNCRIYTYGLGYSNYGDLPCFRELLMKMGKELAEEMAGVSK